jgi:hypothetical protein
MKRSYLIFVVAPLLAACNSPAPPPVAATPAPAVAAAAPAGEAVTAGNMPAHCRGEASALFAVKPAYIQTGAPVKTATGVSIKGTADVGAQGKKPFRCNFDAAGHMGPVESLVDEGKL